MHHPFGLLQSVDDIKPILRDAPRRLLGTAEIKVSMSRRSCQRASGRSNRRLDAPGGAVNLFPPASRSRLTTPTRYGRIAPRRQGVIRVVPWACVKDI